MSPNEVYKALLKGADGWYAGSPAECREMADTVKGMIELIKTWVEPDKTCGACETVPRGTYLASDISVGDNRHKDELNQSVTSTDEPNPANTGTIWIGIRKSRFDELKTENRQLKAENEHLRSVVSELVEQSDLRNDDRFVLVPRDAYDEVMIHDTIQTQRTADILGAWKTQINEQYSTASQALADCRLGLKQS